MLDPSIAIIVGHVGFIALAIIGIYFYANALARKRAQNSVEAMSQFYGGINNLTPSDTATILPVFIINDLTYHKVMMKMMVHESALLMSICDLGALKNVLLKVPLEETTRGIYSKWGSHMLDITFEKCARIKFSIPIKKGYLIPYQLTEGLIKGVA